MSNSADEFDLDSTIPIIVEFGYSFIIGAALGWGIRRAFKWIVAIVGLMVGITVVYQFFGGGTSDFNGINYHYSMVSPVFSHTLQLFTQFLQGNVIRLGGFGIGLISGFKSGNR